MKKTLLLAILSLSLYIFSCTKESEGISVITVDIDFVYNDSAFVINKIYDYPLDYDLKIEQLKLYLSNVYLKKENGQIIPLSSIRFIDASAEGNKINVQIPEGVYNKFAYSIGVPQELNGTQNPDFDAALYSSDHPLSLNNGMYWTWASGYRFVLLDGRVNTDPTVDEEFETLLSIHTGKEYSYRSKELPIQLSAAEDAQVHLSLVFDVEKFLAGDSDVIDIAVDNQSHGTNEALANRLSDNVVNAVSIQ